MLQSLKRAFQFFQSKNKENSDFFCAMPWVHFHVTQNGNVTPCCQAPWDETAALGNINESSIQAIWNGKKFNDFRKQLKNNKPYKACERCYEKEKMGWTSLRQITNHKYKDFIKELAKENFSKSLYEKPVYFDIRFSNVCNLKCRICSFASSSSWHSDAVQLGQLNENTPVLTQSIIDEAKFYKEFNQCIDTVQEIYFAGGEPLLTEQHYTILDFLIKNGKTNCKLFYNTNLTQLEFKTYDLLTYWKNFDFVNLAISLDDIGTRLEYQRKNSNWNTLQKNITIIKENCKTVSLMISPTVSVFNVLYLPKMHQTVVNSSYVNPEDVIPTLLSYPQEYNIRALTPELKKEVEKRINEHLIWLKNKSAQHKEKMDYCLEQYRNILAYIKKQDLPEARKRFPEKITELDKIRNESFETIFPELKPMIEPQPKFKKHT